MSKRVIPKGTHDSYIKRQAPCEQCGTRCKIQNTPHLCVKCREEFKPITCPNCDTEWKGDSCKICGYGEYE